MCVEITYRVTEGVRSRIHISFAVVSKFVKVEVGDQIIAQLLSVSILSGTAKKFGGTHNCNLEVKREGEEHTRSSDWVRHTILG